MANLYTSELLLVEANPVEVLIDRVELTSQPHLEVTKFSAQDVALGTIIPPTTYVENCVDTKTRIRVFLNEGQVAVGEKLQIKLEN